MNRILDVGIWPRPSTQPRSFVAVVLDFWIDMIGQAMDVSLAAFILRI